jgi:hypothetical protein
MRIQNVCTHFFPFEAVILNEVKPSSERSEAVILNEMKDPGISSLSLPFPLLKSLSSVMIRVSLSVVRQILTQDILPHLRYRQ